MYVPGTLQKLPMDTNSIFVRHYDEEIIKNHNMKIVKVIQNVCTNVFETVINNIIFNNVNVPKDISHHD